MMLAKTLSFVGMAAVLTALGGCGASDDSDPAGGGSVVDAVNERGVLRVGVAPAPPYTDLDATTQQWEGIGIDLAEVWAEQLGVETEYMSTTFGSVVAALQSKRFDTTPVLDETPEREGAVLFSEPINTAMTAAGVLPERDDITTWAELNQPDNTVCVANGSATDAALSEADLVAEIQRLPDGNACRLALQAGRVEALFEDWHVLGEYADTTDGVQIVFPEEALRPVGISAALPPTATEADLESLNQAVQEFIESGALAESSKKWGAVDPRQFAASEVPAYVDELGDQEFGAS